jgi:hypothetical protein
MRQFTVTACLVAAVGALMGCCAFAPAASATAGYIDVGAGSATSPAGNPGLLSVSIESDMPITSLTVTVVPAAGGSALLSLPMSDFSIPAADGTGAYGTWTLTSPITTSELAIGTYAVDVTAASADASIGDVPAGRLAFLNQVSFPTFTSNGTAFSVLNQSVTFSGTAMISAPGGSPAAFGTEPIVVSDNAGASYPVTTKADGSFSVTFPAVSGAFTAEYAGDAVTGPATSSAIAVSYDQVPVTLTAKLAAAHIVAGQSDQVEGTLTYFDNGSQRGAGDVPVLLYQSPDTGAIATAFTNASGQFTIPIPDGYSSTLWLVQSQATTSFTASTVVSLPMTTAQPNFILGFRASLDPFAVVHVTGCVGVAGGKAEVQYAARARGRWRYLGGWSPNGDGCKVGGMAGIEYSGSYGARLAAAYYRVVYAGSDQIQGVTTKSVHLAKLFTKLTSFEVSPRSGAENSHFSVSGRLWAEDKHGKFAPYAHRKVVLLLHIDGGWFRYKHEMTTSSAGDFSGRYPIDDSTPVFAQYNGDSTHFASATNRIKIRETRAAAASGAPTPALQLVPLRLAPPLAHLLQAR